MSTLEIQNPAAPQNFRFSGHETFPCRYTWLPKAVRNLRENPALFANEDEAMVRLGVGKNMVRAIRFWADASEVTMPSLKQGVFVSEFGNAVFGPAGHDEFLEDIRTLWLIHWKLSTSVTEPLFAWHYLLNFWHRPEFTRSEALAAFTQEAQRLGKKLSAVTLEHHFTTFLHTYVPTRSRKGEVLEDNLDCPLVELESFKTPASARQQSPTATNQFTRSAWRRSRKFLQTSSPIVSTTFGINAIRRKRPSASVT